MGTSAPAPARRHGEQVFPVDRHSNWKRPPLSGFWFAHGKPESIKGLERRTNMLKVDLIVTRHAALAEYLRAHPLIDCSDARVMDKVEACDVRGKVVAGILPRRLAALCRAVIECEVDLRSGARVEYTLDEVKAHAQPLRAYRVTEFSL